MLLLCQHTALRFALQHMGARRSINDICLAVWQAAPRTARGRLCSASAVPMDSFAPVKGGAFQHRCSDRADGYVQFGPRVLVQGFTATSHL